MKSTKRLLVTVGIAIAVVYLVGSRRGGGDDGSTTIETTTESSE